MNEPEVAALNSLPAQTKRSCFIRSVPHHLALHCPIAPSGELEMRAASQASQP